MSIKRIYLFLLPAALLSTSALAATPIQSFATPTGVQNQQQGYHGPSYGLNTGLLQIIRAGK